MKPIGHAFGQLARSDEMRNVVAISAMTALVGPSDWPEFKKYLKQLVIIWLLDAAVWMLPKGSVRSVITSAQLALMHGIMGDEK